MPNPNDSDMKGFSGKDGQKVVVATPKEPPSKQGSFKLSAPQSITQGGNF